MTLKLEGWDPVPERYLRVVWTFCNSVMPGKVSGAGDRVKTVVRNTELAVPGEKGWKGPGPCERSAEAKL